MASNLRVDSIVPATSGNVSIGTATGGVTIPGDLGIAGVLTYEDVTNIDSVGVITARSDINISSGSLTIPDSIIHSGDTNTKIRFPEADAVTIETNGSERLRINSSGNMNLGSGATIAGLRYLDVQNSSSAANNHGSILRLITSNAAGNSTTSVDIVKYKDGNFFINNNETSGSTNFNTGGSTSLTIHASGAVTKPNNPSFRANRSEGSNYTSTTLNEILPWNVVEFDRTNVSGYGYNNSTYKYRVAVAGVYWFHCAVYTDVNVDVMFDIVKNSNGNYIQRAEMRQSGGDDIGNNTIVHCAGISQCAVGDYIYVNNSGGSAIELIGGGAEGYIDFSGYLIG